MTIYCLFALAQSNEVVRVKFLFREKVKGVLVVDVQMGCGFTDSALGMLLYPCLAYCWPTR